MELSPATLDDALAIAQVHVAGWRAAYVDIVPAEHLAGLSVTTREAAWRQAITAHSPELIVAKDEGIVIGWAAFGQCRDEDADSRAAEIWAIYVSPTHWSTGAGRRLWLQARRRLIEQGFTTASLWVLAENARAIRFYVTAGFRAEAATAKQIQLGGKMLEEIRYVANLTPL